MKLQTCPFCDDSVFITELDTRYSQYAIVHTRNKKCRVRMSAPSERELIKDWNNRKAKKSLSK